MEKRTDADTKTQRYMDVDMHTRKDVETESTLGLEFSESYFRTRIFGLRLSNLDSPHQALALELSDSYSDSDFCISTLEL